MMDLKKAYLILGLEENATDEQVEQRYSLLVIKSRNHSVEAEDNGKDHTFSMEETTKAYNFIKSAAFDEQVRLKEPKNKTIGRIEHIWEYYKWHIILPFIAVLVVIYSINGILDNRMEQKKINRADLQVTFFTDFQIQDTAPFEVKLLENIKDWKDIHIVNQYAPIDPKDEFDMAMIQKATVSMAADKPDVYIMDKANFVKFGRQGAFLPLKDFPALSDVPKDKRIEVRYEDGGSEWVGIAVTNNAAIKALALPNVQTIAVIRGNANKKDNAVKALEWLGQK
ncbi:MAG: hypothetical protein H7X86_04030 [Gorillibacterium sp.]|nr:hypothetical protein [Gorillibacterium sp.]